MKLRTTLAAGLTISLQIQIAAAQGSVSVAPIEGDAPAPVRDAIATSLIAYSNEHGDTAATAATSMSDAASALGCTLPDAACAESVRTTLGVDQIVWGTANGRGPTTIDLYRVDARGQVTHRQTIVAAGSPSDAAVKQLLPELYGEPAVPPPPDATLVTPPPPMVQPRRDSRKPLLIAGVAGGGVFMLVGIGLWSHASGLQDQIDSAPVRTAADIRALQDLENRADSSSTWGNIMFVSGLAVGGIATYFLVKELRRPSQDKIALTPTLMPHGAGLTLTFGGL